MKIRELIVSLGFRADSAAVANFDNAVQGLRARLAGLVTEALQAASTTRGLGRAGQDAARQFGPLTRWQDFALRLQNLRESAALAASTISRTTGPALADLGQRLSVVGRVAAVGAGAIVGFVGGLIANSAAVARQTLEYERQAAALDVTVEKYQELASVFASFGVDSSNMADFFNTIADRAQDAQQGTGEAVTQFKMLGISIRDLRGADPQQILAQLADGFQRATDTTKYLAAASRIFGDDLSRKVIPLLQAGREGIERYTASVRRFGGVLSKDQVRAGAALQLSLARVGVQVDGLRKQLGASLAPALTRIVDRIGDWLDQNSALLRSGIDRWAGRLGLAFDLISEGADSADRAIRHLGGYERMLVGLGVAAGALAAGFVAFQVGGAAFAGATALGGIVAGLATLLGAGAAVAGVPAVVLGIAAIGSAVMTLAPAALVLGTIAAAGVLAVLALDDLWTFIQGGDSLLTRFVVSWTGAGGALGAYASRLSALRDLLRATLDLLSAVGGAAGAVLAAGFRRASAEVTTMLGKLGLLQPVITLADRLFQGIFVEGAASMIRLANGIERVTAGLRGLTAIGKTGGLGALASVFGSAAMGTLGGAPIPSSSSVSSRSSSRTYQGGAVTVNGVGGLDPIAAAAVGQSLQDADRRAGWGVLMGGDE